MLLHIKALCLTANIMPLQFKTLLITANVMPPRFKPLKLTGIRPLLQKKNVQFNNPFVLNAQTVTKVTF